MLPFSTEGFPGYSPAARGPAVPGVSPPLEEQTLVGFGSLCLLCTLLVLLGFSLFSHEEKYS